ncbi:hypothetical protein [Kribbella sp. DT2]|uniref:hypothetical protein n=1 Tax=Kribbella sp. DT2 TaxID=3393427 RepID=UPI003CF1601E
MTWTVEGYVGLGPIKLGADRAGVRAALSEEPKSFTRTAAASASGDEEYESAGVFVYYDDSDRVDFVESYATAGESVPRFGVVSLNGRDMREVLADLDGAGLTPDDDDGASRIFFEAGFAVFSSGYVVESTSVFVKGYYDD